ncbi:MAG: autotransporter outer membrane beta-barrel domain-containing protein [Deltaproteobacteria bacterium]|jgi:hypothetical protein|nr:autotransporter outer membrane beta-barrel domain-containing protein [Deltaproteobacteria bacterium]
MSGTKFSPSGTRLGGSRVRRFFSSLAPAFILAVILTLTFAAVPRAQVSVSSYDELQAIDDSGGTNSRTITVTDTILFRGSPVAAMDPPKDSAINFIKGSGTTVTGSNVPDVSISSMTSSLVADLAAGVRANEYDDASTILADVLGDRISEYATYLNELGLVVVTSPQDTQRIVEDNALGNVHDNNKIFNFRGDSSGLNVSNLRFTLFELIHNFNGQTRNGIQNTFVGNAYNVSESIRIGTVRGNIFEDISITMNNTNTNADNHNAYYAGGGIVGARSTGQSAAIGTVEGNAFQRIRIETTERSYQNFTGAPSIEGGGIIGVEAVANPASLNFGTASLDELKSNYFNGIGVISGDSIIGGGIIGLNNNNQKEHAANNPNENRVRLGVVSDNVFQGGITVAAARSVRGGGVIGLNGLSYSQVDIQEIRNNFFGDVEISAGTYLRGGGVIGIQSFDEALLATDDLVSGYVGKIYDNTFLGIRVSTGNRGDGPQPGGNLIGGGVVGIHTEAGDGKIFELQNNLFREIFVQTSNQGSGMGLHAGDIQGGGVVGVDSKEYGTISLANANVFKNIGIQVQGSLSGGGVLGVNTAVTVPNDQTNEESVLGLILNNTFDGVTVEVEKNFDGGGVIGARAAYGSSGVAGVMFNTFDNVTVNATSTSDAEGFRGGGLAGVAVDDGKADFLSFHKNTVLHFTLNVSSYLEGGGVLGARVGTAVYTDNESLIGEVTSNDIAYSEINVEGHISGGGIIGAFGTGGVASVNKIVDNALYFLNVRAGTYIDGGGIIGANGKMGLTQSNTLSEITDTFIAQNTISADEGQILGGVIYTYGSESDIVFRNSVIVHNSMTSNVYPQNPMYIDTPADYGAKVYGTVTVDTGLARSDGKPITVTLQADRADYAGFSGNVITEVTGFAEVVERRNSFYFGETAESETAKGTGRVTVTPDAVRSDAVLNVVVLRDAAVYLLDPVVVDQIDANGSSKYFQMNVSGEKAGYGIFLWDGENVFEANPNSGNTVNFKADTFTQIFPGMSLTAVNHTLNIDKNAIWEVWGIKDGKNNNFNILAANIAGTLHFHIDGDAHNDPSLVPMTISVNGAGKVSLNGATVEIGTFRVKDDRVLVAGDAYYLIDSGANGKLEAQLAETKVTATQYRGSGQTALRYTFVVDTEVEGAAGRYLVARLVEEHAEPEEVSQVAPPQTAPYEPFIPPVPADPGIAPEPAPPTPAPYPDFPDVVPQEEGGGDKTWIPGLRIVPEGHVAALAHVSLMGTIAIENSPFRAGSAADKTDSWLIGFSMGSQWHEFGDEAKTEVRGANLRFGLDKNIHHGSGGSTLIGFLIEGSFVNYDVSGDYGAYDADAAIAEVSGTGKFGAVGAGVVFRHAFPNDFGIEGSLRAGRFENEFRANNYGFDDGTPVRYDYRAPYFGAHAGVVYGFDINEVSSIDFALRYFLTRVKALEVDVSGKDTIKFDATDSNRLRGGFRYTRRSFSFLEWHGGLYLDNEFSGTARAHSSHDNVDFGVAKLKGATGVLELGGLGRFGDRQNFTLEFGLRGYVGKYGGISGGLSFGVEF